MKQIIGIVGPIASGKGVVISLLKNKGYNVLSLSDVVRNKTNELGLEITRENLQNVGDSLRHDEGNDILAKEIAPEIQQHIEEKFVIDAIRNPAEVAYLQKEFDAYIIGITASPETRFKLMQLRNKDYDPKTWEEFVQAEKRDRGIGQENFGQQVEKCLQMADTVLENNGSLEEFEEKITSRLHPRGGLR